jgi:hypothetical protein
MSFTYTSTSPVQGIELGKLFVSNCRGKDFHTCEKLAIEPGRSIGHNALNLQELLDIVIAADNCEAQAPRTFHQARSYSLTLQRVWIPREARALIAFAHGSLEIDGKDSLEIL